MSTKQKDNLEEWLYGENIEEGTKRMTKDEMKMLRRKNSELEYEVERWREYSKKLENEVLRVNEENRKLEEILKNRERHQQNLIDYPIIEGECGKNMKEIKLDNNFNPKTSSKRETEHRLDWRQLVEQNRNVFGVRTTVNNDE